MVRGKIRPLGSIIGAVLPGSVIYTLGSVEPMIVTFVFDDQAVITNSGQILNRERMVRTIFECQKEFQVNWKNIENNSAYNLTIEPFDKSFFRPGVMVLVKNEVNTLVTTKVIVKVDEKTSAWVTEEAEKLHFSKNHLIIDSGVTCLLDIEMPAI